MLARKVSGVQLISFTGDQGYAHSIGLGSRVTRVCWIGPMGVSGNQSTGVMPCGVVPKRQRACAVALAQRGPVGLGGGSMRPNAYGASGSDSKTGKFPQRDGKEGTLANASNLIPAESICQ